MRKDLTKNIIKIVNCLKAAEEGWLWYREISRRVGLHHKTISRLIEKHLQMFLDVQTMEPFNVKMVRLKPGTDVNGIFRYLTVKEKLENVRK
jgi:hypothetical protein